MKKIGPIFFDKKYLSGKFFEKSAIGWHWVLRGIIFQKILGFNRHIPWPVSPFIIISDPKNIEFDIDCIDNFQAFGSYFQNFSGKILIGRNTIIGPNVGIITANHDLNNFNDWPESKNVIIGDNCWIGMNSVILPGVTLGEHTIVGAGSIVTKSFPEGNFIIGGNPAKVIKSLDRTMKQEKCSKNGIF